MSKLSLAGRSVVVVGAGGGGIGTAIVRMVASEGAFVTAVDRDAAALDQAMAAVEAAGARGQRCAGTAEGARRSWRSRPGGALHGLVNVVGGLPITRWASPDYSEETSTRCCARLKVAFTSQAAREPCSESLGSIVQIATIAALRALRRGICHGEGGPAGASRTMSPSGARLNPRQRCRAGRSRSRAIAAAARQKDRADPDESSRDAR
jgi:NAD(P)-dependent dehydrogenase (short-subunit alcohol dehydrogenase family)